MKILQFKNSKIQKFKNSNDIDAAIQHIHSNFPTCLGINANNIQVMGESAGASIALLYAYTKANTSVVKSVVSVAGSTNMNQFADYLNNKPTPLYSCGGNYVLLNSNNTGYTNIPYYLFTDISVISTSVASVSPLSCTLGTTSFTLNGPQTNNTNTNLRITDSYKLAQSTVKQTVTTPLTSTLFSNISPCVQLNSSRIIPTFIIHGLDDWIVPYNKATNTMDTKMTNTGGLIGIYNNIFPSTIPSSGQYASFSSKHLMKLYYGANHDVSNQSQVLPDIITWFNGH